MKWYSRIGIGIGAFIFSLASSYFIVKDRVEKGIQPYVESHLVAIIKDQEDKLGIQHFGIPRIVYEKQILLYDGSVGFKEDRIFGIYKAKTDEIHLSSSYLVTPDTNLINIIATTVFDPELANVEEILAHELGHFYIDKFNESLGRGSWSNREDGNKAVSEGISEYFRKVLNNGGDGGVRLSYDMEFNLVKPIIDKYGKRGIDYLIANPPNVKEESSLEYQNRVLEALADSHN